MQEFSENVICLTFYFKLIYSFEAGVMTIIGGNNKFQNPKACFCFLSWCRFALGRACNLLAACFIQKAKWSADS
jgi:hypothetical protein